MKFISLLIDRPRILFLTLSFILLAGISSALSVPIQENPELAQRWSGVRVFYPGASPERIETQVINDLEIKLREVVEILELETIISHGYATIVVELQQSVSPDLIEETWSKVQDKLSQIRAPPEVNIVLDRNSGPPITVQYALKWNGQGEAPLVLMSRLAEQLKRKLSSIGDTHATAIYGETDEEILIEVDSNKITSLGLTYREISEALKSFDNKKAVGVSSNKNSEFLIRLKDNIKSIQKLSEIPIRVINDSEIIQLQDIAQISKKPVSPIEDIFLYNGEVVISVMAMGTMSQRVGDYVARATVVADEMKSSLPDEISIEKIYDESLYTSAKFNELIKSFSLAFFFVLGLSFFFLGLRPAIIVTLILPFSVCFVMIGCRIIGLPLHMTSITGIIIALGLLIDNGIIVVEDYKYRRGIGLTTNESISQTLTQLSTPLAAATGTTVFSFLPIVTGEGSSVEFVGGMALTVIMSIVSSLVLALIMVPVLMSYMEKIPYFQNIDIYNEGYHNKKILDKYRTFLTWAFLVPRRAIIISVSLPLLGFLLFNTLPKDFFPSNDRDMFRINIELPSNASSEQTLGRAKLIREQVLNSGLIEIEKDYWFIGRMAPRVLMNVVGGKEKQGSNNMAQSVFYAKDYYEMIRNLPELSKLIAQKNPDIIINTDSFIQGPPVFADVSFAIYGDDPFVLKKLGEELELIINNAPGVSFTKSDTSNTNTNIELELNNSNISLSKVNANLLVDELYAANNGIIVGTMLDSNKEIPIRLKGLTETKNLTGNASFLTVPSGNGFEYIDSFSKSSITNKSSKITRIDGQRVNMVEGWIWTQTLPSETENYIIEDVEIFKSKLPIGYSIKQLGEAESRGESQSQIYSSAAVYIVLIIIGLVFALNSFRQTALILSVAILSIGLSFLGLFIGQQNYGFIGTISAVGLIGLSINDSIIVLSHIKEEAEKKDISKAEIVEVVIRSTRHIITTSLTTLGGFVPLIFASVFFKPLAWAMSIGVLGATLTALLYIPAMFVVMKKINY
ncbi:MAG: efflux RND transporter permease subunit [Proteobacteria bacterium]|jgi:multidrug efflux pump subunit AcrB|nr:efflux RND transporter permease subunit [Pseudomonadota bacterium]MDA1083666.1 efflux RND transporter permease subunit [Pseudomonadota bacterium]